ncbi:FG-GAP-like repeat-containing protein [Streptomyces tateyamensis]|nr:FG-GAP-like repeat-containing protein [Streptomyces tateyamensis]
MDHAPPCARTGRTGRGGRSRLALLATALLACAATALGPTGATAAPLAPATLNVGSPSVATAPVGTLFDDFHYNTDTSDPAFAAHGWTPRDGQLGSGPGPQDPVTKAVLADWSKDNVTFPFDPSVGGPVMQLRATNDGRTAHQAQVSTTQRKFTTGTYAARVYFNDQPTSGDPGARPVEAFYTIAPENPLRRDLYSELDNEYLPAGGWSGASTNPSLWTTSWYHVAEPAAKIAEDKANFNNHDAVNHLQGWHTLEMTVATASGGAEAATFYLDGAPYFPADPSYAPREPMTIDFNTWFTALAPGHPSTWDEKVSWVYYTNTGALPPTQLDGQVSSFHTAGTHFVDTVRAPKTAHDYDGNGLGDISMVYDYGPSAPNTCARSGTRHTTFFDLAGQPDPRTQLSPATQWDGPCQPAGQRFTTSGDFNGDGRADLAALYDYGPTATCPQGSHVAVLEWQGTADGSLHPLAQPAWESPCFGSGTAYFSAGDFNGDGKSDLALLYDYGGGDLKLLTLTADGNGDGGFGGLVPQWEGKTMGTSTKFMVTGDYNGDGKSDVALYTDCGDGNGPNCLQDARRAVWTFSADPVGSGALAGPVQAWHSPGFGSGTKAVSSGDIDGDGRSDLVLLFDDGTPTLQLITLTAHANGDGAFGGLVERWHGTALGVVPSFMSVGDYNGDGKADIALFTDYGATGSSCGPGGHQSVYALTADPYGTGGLQDPVRVWDSPCWGQGTRSVN